MEYQKPNKPSVLFRITNHVPYTNTVRVAANHLWTAVHRHLSTVLEAASLARSAGGRAVQTGRLRSPFLLKPGRERRRVVWCGALVGFSALIWSSIGWLFHPTRFSESFTITRGRPC